MRIVFLTPLAALVAFAVALPLGAAFVRRDGAELVALRRRRSLRRVPAGIASLTDRVLPRLVPTADERVFASTLRRSIGIGRPASGTPAAERSTDIQALQMLQTGYFGPVR